MSVISYSIHGGMSYAKIEEKYPEDLYKLYIDHRKGTHMVDLLKIAPNLGLSKYYASTLAFLVKNLYECFVQRDCDRITVNPLIFTKQGEFCAANPRVYIDPKAHYR